VTRIEINDFSLKGFTALLNFIYSGEETVIMKTQDLEELFELYNLAEKYFLTELKTLVSKTMQNLPFSVKNYAAVFTTVAKYENLLHTEELCQDLLKRCASAVKKSWWTVDDSTSFWSADYNDDVSLKAALLQKISTLSSRHCHTLGDWKDKKKCKYVRATANIVSKENDFIGPGCRGYVRYHKRATLTRPECWIIHWDHLTSIRTHYGLKEGDIEPEHPHNRYGN
jgi:hypothetical protein